MVSATSLISDASRPSSVLYGQVPQRQITVVARALSADLKLKICFDATPYLGKLDDEELRYLAGQGWKGAPALKAFVIAADEDGCPEARQMIEYCQAYGQSWSVMLNGPAADDWLASRLNLN